MFFCAFMEIYMNILHYARNTRELARTLGVKYRQLNLILYSYDETGLRGTDKYYKSFDLNKKNGGVRHINAPTGELLCIQKKISKILQASIKTNNISHGFNVGRSIYSNANVHHNKRYVLNLDLEDFFDSVHFGRVRGFFIKNNSFKCSENIATILAQLTCYNGKLPQGAPSSPVLTNLICNIMDYHILKIAKKYKLNYTRYADDMTFSTNDKNFLELYNQFMADITVEVNQSGFRINDRKTRLQYKDSRQEVTGLIVNKNLSVPNEYYKTTRAMAYSLYKNGYYLLNGQEGTINQLDGRLMFINNKYLANSDKTMYEFTKRQRELQTFLFYRYFYMNDMPLICTEGKTDVLYIKAALLNYADEYPELIDEDGFLFHFFKRTNRMNKFFGIQEDGADTWNNFHKKFCSERKDSKKYYSFFNQFQICSKYPVILLFDNEQDNKHPLGKFLKDLNLDILKNELNNKNYVRIDPQKNMYILTIPKLKGDSNVEIEDLFDEKMLNIELNGKKFCRNGKDDNSFGKEIFSKYVYSHRDEIDFGNFKYLLNGIRDILDDYSQSLQ